MIRYAILAAAFATTGGAHGFGTNAYCAKLHQETGASHAELALCQRLEFDAMRELHRMRAPRPILEFCREVASASGGSFQVLEQCVRLETAVKSRA